MEMLYKYAISVARVPPVKRSVATEREVLSVKSISSGRQTDRRLILWDLILFTQGEYMLTRHINWWSTIILLEKDAMMKIEHIVRAGI